MIFPDPDPDPFHYKKSQAMPGFFFCISSLVFFACDVLDFEAEEAITVVTDASLGWATAVSEVARATSHDEEVGKVRTCALVCCANTALVLAQIQNTVAIMSCLWLAIEAA